MSFKTNSLLLSDLATPISTLFINKYMPAANHTFSVIYIHTLSLCIAGNAPKNNTEISNTLNVLESDIIKAWQYWHKEGIVSYDQDSDIIEFLPLPKEEKIATEPTKKPVMPVLEKQVDYSPEELNLYTKNSDAVRQLFESAQNYLAKLLTHKDLSIIFSFYDWYRLPMEVIEILLAYCTSKGHYKLSYIETVARDWSEKNIDSIQKAHEYISLQESYNSNIRKIMKAFGQNNREPLKFELDFINKWAAYDMPLEIIEKACERTVINTGKCNFQYCDTIITSWKEKNIKTLEDIALLDEKFYNAKKPKIENSNPQRQVQKSAPVPKTNRFVNYDQRSWDFDELKKLERQYAKKKLEG